MAELGIAIAAKLIEAIGKEMMKKIIYVSEYESELEDLEKIVEIIRRVLFDAESRPKLSTEEEGYIQDLTNALYDADDLLEGLMIDAEQLNEDKNGKLSDKVRGVYSYLKEMVGRPSKISREVCKAKKQLDSIARNHKKFGFSTEHKSNTEKIQNQETSSILPQAHIILGRENDKEVILKKLLDPPILNDGIRFVSIVGVGGLGKTTLAQLVYNDDKVRNQFQARLWVCVPRDGFEAKLILCKILELVEHRKVDTSLSLELVRDQFQKLLGRRKFFLVLDDIWSENGDEWTSLKDFLLLGKPGSRVVITTRSHLTASITRDIAYEEYELQGLSIENSRRLFEMSAFNRQYPVESIPRSIWQKIVDNCYRNPYAITKVGNLLISKDIETWRLLHKSVFAKIDKDENMVMSKFKLSYVNLESSLKSCFRYCALFPKDIRIEKEMLISLWIAQGYIVPLNEDQDVEDAAEENFKTLLRRCFFQDLEMNDYGDVMSFKIHGLMHDIAHEVGRQEISVATFGSKKLGDKIRHVRSDGGGCSDSSSCSTKIRSYMCWHHTVPLKDLQIENWVCLRVLDLSFSGFKSLTGSIDKLRFLKYINLAFNGVLETLSASITELHCLQTLILRDCKKLRELPENFSKLVKLRHLDLYGCCELTSMPAGMNKLTNLRVLPFFVVGKRDSSQDELNDLKSLPKIKGDICIDIGENYRHVKGINGSEGGYLRTLVYLKKVTIKFDDKCANPKLEILEPHPNLKALHLIGYKGTTVPRWASLLSSLVNINLTKCTNLQQIPVLSKLLHLKSLTLIGLENLEYMESTNSSTRRDTEAEKRTEFFPSLESLLFENLIKLKGWWNVDGSFDDLRSIRFHCLSQLTINRCPRLISFPLCPTLKSMNGCEVAKSCESSPRSLEIGSFIHLRIFCEGVKLEHLTLLESLKLSHFDQLSILEDDKIMPWKSFRQSLRSLHFYDIKNMICLPEGIQYLTSLESIYISFCDNIKVLPEWISCLSSLQSLCIYCCPALKSLPNAIKDLTSLKMLEIDNCPELVERCKKSNGEERPKIQHIPHIQDIVYRTSCTKEATTGFLVE